MKKILVLSCLLFWGGCKTTPLIYAPQFEKFSIQKMTEKGIETVDVTPTQKDWPELSFKEAKPYMFDAKKLKIAVIGDTGCRLKEVKNAASYQNCADSKEWPYADIIKNLNVEKFDFAIHTGDYHYREQCSDPKLCPAYTKSLGYTWAAWWDDFYGPSQLLFAKAPLLLIRGNHEDCARAFSGWNPLSPINKKFNESCEAVEPYQWIEMQDIVFINFDDSAFDDRKESKPQDREKFLNILKEISKRIVSLKTKKEVWFLAHKPVYGYVPDKDNNLVPFAIAPLLKTLLEESKLLEHVDYFLSGHIHNQQLVVSKSDLMQIIVGHSGTALDPFGKKISDDKFISSTETQYHFGYALFERLGFKKWNFKFKNLASKVDLECNVNNKKMKCF